MGISLAPGDAVTELQALAVRARSGDKCAQFELGTRFEEGRGVPRDFARARKLYGLAASATGGPSWIYVPAAAKGQQGRVMQVENGPRIAGLKEARDRLDRLHDW